MILSSEIVLSFSEKTKSVNIFCFLKGNSGVGALRIKYKIKIFHLQKLQCNTFLEARKIHLARLLIEQSKSRKYFQ